MTTEEASQAASEQPRRVTRAVAIRTVGDHEHEEVFRFSRERLRQHVEDCGGKERGWRGAFLEEVREDESIIGPEEQAVIETADGMAEADLPDNVLAAFEGSGALLKSTVRLALAVRALREARKLKSPIE